MRTAIALVIAVSGLFPAARAGWWVENEFGMVFGGYNDIRVPATTGTEYSFTGDLDDDPAVFARLRPGYTFGKRHHLSLLLAPLRLEAEGSFDQDVSFNGVLFPAGAPVEGSYRFDSYRLRYRYQLYKTPELVLSAGATAKIRDASITLSSGAELSARKSNTGFVPLLSFRGEWHPGGSLYGLLDVDALVGPQGRAEDVFLGLGCRLGGSSSLLAGYRFLEGGADVEEVYNFTMLHYASLGARIEL